jgi:hypothetical protein
MSWMGLLMIILIVLGTMLFFKHVLAKKMKTGEGDAGSPFEAFTETLNNHPKPAIKIIRTSNEASNVYPSKIGNGGTFENKSDIGQVSMSYSVKELPPRICYICGRQNPGVNHRHS